MQFSGVRVLHEIGRITAASGWHGSAGDAVQRERALQRLIEAAKEYDADAIIGVDYVVDGGRQIDLADVPVQRVQVTGIAVKLAKAA